MMHLLSNAEIGAVVYRRDGQIWIFAGRWERKQELLREPGIAAADLDSPFTWDDAAVVTAAIRAIWPDVTGFDVACNCPACQAETQVSD